MVWSWHTITLGQKVKNTEKVSNIVKRKIKKNNT